MRLKYKLFAVSALALLGTQISFAEEPTAKKLKSLAIRVSALEVRLDELIAAKANSNEGQVPGVNCICYDYNNGNPRRLPVSAETIEKANKRCNERYGNWVDAQDCKAVAPAIYKD